MQIGLCLEEALSSTGRLTENVNKNIDFVLYYIWTDIDADIFAVHVLVLHVFYILRLRFIGQYKQKYLK